MSNHDRNIAGDQPTAFVIMPYDESYDELYDGFLKPVISDCGFLSVRADDLQNSQNIINDIVDGIHNANVVVADLTDLNPNVFYELGLAHAMNRPTILLSQGIDDLPFDLRSYRVIQYSSHFVHMDQARIELRARLRGYIDGTTQFGSPVSDTLGSAIALYAASRALVDLTSVDDESISGPGSGFLDHLADIEGGFEVMNEQWESLGSRTVEVSNVLQEATSKLQPGVSARDARIIARNVAREFDNYARRIDDANGVIASQMDRIAAPLELVMSQFLSAEDLDIEEVRQNTLQFSELDAQIDDVLGSMYGFRSVIQEMPDAETTLNRARSRLVGELGLLIGNALQLKSLIGRIQRAGEQRLEDEDGGWS